jgi:hypothetical protein
MVWVSSENIGKALAASMRFQRLDRFTDYRLTVSVAISRSAVTVRAIDEEPQVSRARSPFGRHAAPHN